MNEPDTSRRSFLRASAGVASAAAVGGLAGCLEAVPFVGGGGQLQAVPEDANGVLYADVDAVRTDAATEAVVNTYLSARARSDWYDGPESLAAALSTFEDEWDLDPAGLHEVAVLAGYGGEYGLVDEEYAAAVVTTDWSASDLTDAMTDGSGYDFEETDRSGRTMYEPTEDWGPYVGVVSKQELVVGQKDAVEDAIDATVGEEDGVEAELRSAYTDTRDAPVRYASVVPDPGEYDSVPESVGRGSGEISLGVLEDVTTVAGSVYADGDTRGLRSTLTADDGDTAENLQDIVDGALSFAGQNAYSETVADLIGDVEVSQNGRRVTLSIEKTVGELEDLVEETTNY